MAVALPAMSTWASQVPPVWLAASLLVALWALWAPLLRALSYAATVLLALALRSAASATGAVHVHPTHVTVELRGLRAGPALLAWLAGALPAEATEARVALVCVRLGRSSLWSLLPTLSVHASGAVLRLRRRTLPPRRAYDELQARVEAAHARRRREQLRAVDLLLWRWLPPESLLRVALRQVVHLAALWALRHVILRVEGLEVTYELEHEAARAKEPGAPLAVRLKMAAAGVQPTQQARRSAGRMLAAVAVVGGGARSEVVVKGVNLEVDSAAGPGSADVATSVIFKRWSAAAAVSLSAPSPAWLMVRGALQCVLRRQPVVVQHTAAVSSLWLYGELVPTLAVDVTVSALLLSVDKPSILALRALDRDLQACAAARKLKATRPTESPAEDPREWWRHAVATIVRERWQLATKAGVVPFVKAFTDGITNKPMSDAALRRRYGELYARSMRARRSWLGYLSASLSRAEQAELDFIERHLGALDIARYRWWVAARAARDAGELWDPAARFERMAYVALRSSSPLVALGAPGVRLAARIACAKVSAVVRSQAQFMSPQDGRAGDLADIARIEVRLLRGSVDMRSSGELRAVARVGTLLCFDCVEEDQRLSTVVASPGELVAAGDPLADSVFKATPARGLVCERDEEDFWGGTTGFAPFLEAHIRLPAVAVAALGSGDNEGRASAATTSLDVRLASANVTYVPGLLTRYALLLPSNVLRTRAGVDAVSEAAASALAGDVAASMVRSRSRLHAVLETQAKDMGQARSLSVEIGAVRLVMACPPVVQQAQSPAATPLPSEQHCYVLSAPATHLRSGRAQQRQRTHTLKGPRRAERLREHNRDWPGAAGAASSQGRSQRVSSATSSKGVTFSALEGLRRAINFGGESLSRQRTPERGAAGHFPPSRQGSGRSGARRADESVTIDEMELRVELEMSIVPMQHAFIPGAAHAAHPIVSPVQVVARVVSGRNVSSSFTRVLRLDGRCSPVCADVSPFSTAHASRLAFAVLADFNAAVKTMQSAQRRSGSSATPSAAGGTRAGGSSPTRNRRVTVRLLVPELSVSLCDSSPMLRAQAPQCCLRMHTVHATLDASKRGFDANIFFGGLAVEDLTARGRAATRTEDGHHGERRYLLAPLPAPVRLGAFSAARMRRDRDAGAATARAFHLWRRWCADAAAKRAAHANGGDDGRRGDVPAVTFAEPSSPTGAPPSVRSAATQHFVEGDFCGRQSEAQIHLRVQSSIGRQPAVSIDVSILRVLLDFDSVLDLARLCGDLAKAAAAGRPPVEGGALLQMAGPGTPSAAKPQRRTSGLRQRGGSTASRRTSQQSSIALDAPSETTSVISMVVSCVTVTLAAQDKRWAMFNAQDVESSLASCDGETKFEMAADDFFVVDLLAASHHYRRIIDEVSSDTSCGLKLSLVTRTWTSDSREGGRPIVSQQTIVRGGLTNVRIFLLMRFYKDCKDSATDFFERLRAGAGADGSSADSSDLSEPEMDERAGDPPSGPGSAAESDAGVTANDDVTVLPTLVFFSMENVRLDAPRNCYAPDQFSLRFDRLHALLPAPDLTVWSLTGQEHLMSVDHLFTAFAAADSASTSRCGRAPAGIALHLSPVAVYWCNRATKYPGLWMHEEEAGAPCSERLELRTAAIDASIDFPPGDLDYAVHIRTQFVQGVVGETQFGLMLGVLWENSFEAPTFGVQVGYPRPNVEVRENYRDAQGYGEVDMGVTESDKCIAHIRIDVEDLGCSLEGVRRSADLGDGSGPRVAALGLTGSTLVCSYFEGVGRLVRLSSDAIDIIDQQPGGDERVDFFFGKLTASSRARCRPLVSAPAAHKRASVAGGGAQEPPLGSARYRPGGGGEWSRVEAFCLDYLIKEDRTHVMELGVSAAEVMWPYDTDFNLVWQIKDMFTAYLWRPYVFMNPPDSRPLPWMYFNIIFKQSQLRVPFFKDSRAPLAKRFLKSHEMGLEATFEALRVGYFFGGDGENPLKLDLVQLAVGAYHARRRRRSSEVPRPSGERRAVISQDASAKPSSHTRALESRILEPTTLHLSVQWCLPREKAEYTTDVKLSVDDARLRVCFGQMHADNDLYSRVVALASRVATESAEPWEPYYANMPPPPWLPPYPDHSWRSCRMNAKLSVQNVSAILVDDRGHVCRDVLMASVTGVRADMLQEQAAHGQDPTLFAVLRAGLGVRYLNSAIEAMSDLLDPWPVTAEVKSSNKGQTMKLTSPARMNLKVCPELLRSLGDAIAFSSGLGSVIAGVNEMERLAKMGKAALAKSPLFFPAASPTAGGGDRIKDRMRSLAHQTRAKVAESDYILHNHTGRGVSYWIGNVSLLELPSHRRFVIREGAVQYLRVVPEETLLVPSGGDGDAQPRRAKIITVFVEGALAPVSRVLVDRVGTYMYEVQMPLDGRTAALPMIVEVSLQGRLKVLTLRSTMAIRNNTDCNLHFRLHRYGDVHGASTGRRGVRQPVVVRIPPVGVVQKGEMVHLPLACPSNGGVLYVHPEGFQRADKDVIALDRDALREQQGMLCCPSLVPDGPSFYCCLDVVRRSVPNMAFGAHDPVDVDILDFLPPMLLQNRLPYETDFVVYDRAAGTEHVTTIGPGEERALYDVNLDHALLLGANIVEPPRAFDETETDSGEEPATPPPPMPAGGRADVRFHTLRPAVINRPVLRWARRRDRGGGSGSGTDSAVALTEQLGETIMRELESRDFRSRTMHLATGPPPVADGESEYVRPRLVGGAISETRVRRVAKVHQPGKVSLRLRLHVSKDSRCRARTVAIFAPYWILNETGVPLLVRDSIRAVPTQCPPRSRGDLRAPAPRLYFTTKDSASVTVDDRKLSKWSKMFPIDGLGMKGAVTVLANRRSWRVAAALENSPLRFTKHELGVDVSIAPGAFHRTKVLRITPRFILKNLTRREHLRFGINDAEFDRDRPDEPGAPAARAREHIELEVRQRDVKDSAVLLPHDQLVPHHWVDRDRRPELQVRPARGGWNWSAGFRIDEAGQYALRVRSRRTGRCMILPLTVSLGATVCVVFGGASTSAPYVIENRCTHIGVRFEQVVGMVEREARNADGTPGRPSLPYSTAAFESEDVLPPGARTPYAWDAPSSSHKLRVQFGTWHDDCMDEMGEVITREFHLDKIRTSASIKITLSRRTVSSAPSAIAAGELADPGAAPREPSQASGSSDVSGDVEDSASPGEAGSPRKQMFARGSAINSIFNVARSVTTRTARAVAKRLRQGIEGRAPETVVVYACVFARGPTRVLLLSEDPEDAAGATEEEELRDLEQRIEVLDAQIKKTNAELADHQWAGAGPGMATPTGSVTLQRVPSARLGRSTSAGRRSSFMSPVAQEVADLCVAPSPLIATRYRQTDGEPRNSFKAARSPLEVARRSEHERRMLAMRARRANSATVRSGSGASLSAFGGSSGDFGSGSGVLDFSGSDMESIPDEGAGAGHSSVTALARVAIRTRNGRVNAMASPVGPALQRSSTAVKTGNLHVGVLEARGLRGPSDRCHPYAVLECNDDIRRTRALKRSTSPTWDESIEFEAISSAFHLKVTLYSSDLITADTFLGEVRIHLAETVPPPLEGGSGAKARRVERWFTLSRRRARERVSGEVRLSFEWASFRGALAELKLKHRALEQDLQVKLELLALFQEKTGPSNPMDPAAWRVATWHPAARAIARLAPQGGNSKASTPVQWVTPEPAVTWVTPEPVGWAGGGHGGGMAAGSMDSPEEEANAFRLGALEVRVVEGRALNVPSGGGGIHDLMRGLGPSDAYARVSCSGQIDQTEVVSNSASPVWDPGKIMRFENISERSALHVQVFHKRTFGSDVLLGEATVPCGVFDDNRPEYVWVALSLPDGSGGIGAGHANRLPREGLADAISDDALTAPQAADASEANLSPGRRNLAGEAATLRLRVHWRDTNDLEAAHLKANVSLAEIALTVVDNSPRELMHVFLESLSLDFASTATEETMRFCVGFLQVDNQLLNTANPVVLAPTLSARLASGVPIAMRGAEAGDVGALQRFGVTKQHLRSDNTVVVSFRRTKVDAADEGISSTTARSHSGSMEGAAGASASVSAVAATAAAATADERAPDYLHFQSFDAELAEIDLLLEEDFTNALMEFVATLPLGDLRQTATGAARVDARRDPSQDVAAVVGMGLHVTLASHGHRVSAVETGRWYFEKLRLFPIKINVTLSVTSDVRVERDANFYRFLSASGFSLIDVDNVHLRIAGYEDENAFMGHEEIRKKIQWHYTMQLLRALHSLLGKVNFLGTPVTLVSSLGSGVYDFFSDPVRNLRSAGAGATTREMARLVGGGMATGTISLLRNTGFGVFDTVSQMTGATAKGLALLSMDDDFMLRLQHNKRRTAMSSAEHLVRGAQQLGLGIFEGLSGLVMKPISGARSDGARGCLKGVLKGFAGLAVKPTAGALEFAASTATAVTSGIDRAGREMERAPKTRIHEPRPASAESDLIGVGAGGATADWEAQCQSQRLRTWDKLLHQLRRGKYARDATRDYVHIRDNMAVVVTTHRLMYVDLLAARRVWTVYLSRITDVVGLERRLQVIVSFRTTFGPACLGCGSVGAAGEPGDGDKRPGVLRRGIPLTLRKIIYCRSHDQYHAMLVKLHRHRVREPTEDGAAALTTAAAGSIDDDSVRSLRGERGSLHSLSGQDMAAQANAFSIMSPADSQAHLAPAEDLTIP